MKINGKKATELEEWYYTPFLLKNKDKIIVELDDGTIRYLSHLDDLSNFEWLVENFVNISKSGMSRQRLSYRGITTLFHSLVYKGHLEIPKKIGRPAISKYHYYKRVRDLDTLEVEEMVSLSHRPTNCACRIINDSIVDYVRVDEEGNILRLRG